MSRKLLAAPSVLLGSIWLLVACLSAAMSASAPQAATASDIAAQYKDKLVLLRVPSCSSRLTFDAEGNMSSPAQFGDWQTCVGVRIRDVHVEDGKIKIAGQRIPISYDCGTKQVREVPDVPVQPGGKTESSPQQVSIEISLLRGDETAAKDVMAKAFLAPDEGNTLADGAHRLGLGYLPPVAIYQPEPSYSDAARKAAYEGTVRLTVTVGVDGLVHQAAVVRSLGMGLDENAIETVRTWRFKPATRCGTPVPIEVSVEVSFNLPRRK